MGIGALSRFFGKGDRRLEGRDLQEQELRSEKVGGRNGNGGKGQRKEAENAIESAEQIRGKHRRVNAIQKPLAFWSEEKGQVSAEMLIIIAAMVGVALVLVSQLQSSAKTGAKNLDAKTDKAWSEIDKIGK